MDLRQLRYFLEIIEQGSVSRAAGKLNVAQPALSIHLRNMEKELGTELLLRHRHGIEPTEAGAILARHARFMLSEQTKVIEDIRHFGKEPAGEVRLGLPGTMSDVLTVPLIAYMAQHYPRIRLTVSEAMSGFVGEWLRDGQVDLAVLYNPVSDPSLEAEAIIEEELLVLGAPGDLQAGTISYPELLIQKLILPSRAHGLRQMIDMALEKETPALRPVIEIDSYSNIKELVIRGFGLSILPHHAIAKEVQSGRLSCAKLSPTMIRKAYFVTRAFPAPSRAVKLTYEALGIIAAGLISEGEWLGTRLLRGGSEALACSSDLDPSYFQS